MKKSAEMSASANMGFDKIADAVCSYIDYLKKEHNLDVSIHFAQKFSYVFSHTSSLIKYNNHTNPYCFKVKEIKRRHKRCIKCQAAALKKCSSESNYIGVCHAGVREFICGIYYGGETAGFVSVSGYTSDKLPYCTDKTYIENMKSDEVPTELLKVVVPPLCMMAERLVGFKELKNLYDDIYYKILDFLRERHMNISVDEIAKHFHFSKSYISHMFKKKNGHTIKEYCNILKINDAKALLEDSNMSVTEVSLTAGFNNFSYFINVFKNMTGMTPLKWRMRHRSNP